MFNKDLIKENTAAVMQKMSDALAANDVEAATEAMQEMQNDIAESIEKEFQKYGDSNDMQVLQSRGLRALTSEEQEWYEKFIGAVKIGSKQAITDLDKAMPVTIFDRVLEDMKKAHPLLDAITIQNAAGAMRLVMNGTQMSAKLGSWKALGSSITDEVSGQIKYIDVATLKYTAYFLIPKDFVKFNFGFAPMWVDQYVRLVLSETIANGLEKTIIQGDGDSQWIGLAFDVSTSVGGVYSEKEAISMTDWDQYATIIANNLLVDGNSDYRDLSEVLMVVNPSDYVKKIRPAQQVITGAGIVDYINHSFPTRIVVSSFVTAGTAKLGIAKNYFAAINGGTSGIVEFSDEAKFLDDVRVYTTRVYGNGRPIDNSSFVNLDISNLAPAYFNVKEIQSF